MMFPETALFVVNYILARRPRTPSPRRVIEEMPWKRLVSLHPAAYSSRQGLQDYWISPQRRHPAGSTERTSRKRWLILPGSTGVSDVESVHWPSSGQYRHKLILGQEWTHTRWSLGGVGCSLQLTENGRVRWKHRWQYLNYYYLGKRPSYRFL